MQPQNAVAILVASDDQNVIDILRRTEEIAAETGASSMVAYWLSLMPAERAAQIQRKMLEKPTTLE
jgi:flagellar protein FlbB